MAVPLAPFETFEPCDAKTCGSELTRSSVRVVPDSFTSWLLTVVTGLAVSRFGCGIREPVTTISCVLVVGAPDAFVLGTPAAACGATVTGVVGTALVSGGFWRRVLRVLRKSGCRQHAGANE